MNFTSIPGLVGGLIAFIAGVVLLLRARHRMPTTMLILLAIGLALLALACAELLVHWPVKPRIVVMVDLSPSTRGAEYRNRDALDKRVRELIGDAPHDLVYFAASNTSDASGNPLADLPANETIFSAPSAAFVLVFTDGQFDVPVSAPPTYVVTDPNLEHPDDAGVRSLHLTDHRATVDVANSGAPRTLTWSGADQSPVVIPTGASIESATISTDATLVTARLNSADRWSENDALSIHVPPAPQAQRWWIGASPADATWRSFAPAQLPTDANAYLDSAMIVLDNVPADALSIEQQTRLAQYVRDLGGSLVIVGGNHAFAAGDYARTILDDLSPLASEAPAPTTHWILLLDSSGSMSQALGQTTRFRAAADAINQLIAHLPASDLLSVGGFARDLSWWIQRQPVGKVAEQIPPASAIAFGPTNLEAALQAVAQSADRSLPNELLVISDADAAINDVPALANSLRNARVRVSVLAIGAVHNDRPVAQIASLTGGKFIQQTDAAQWPAAIRELARQVAPPRLIQQPSIVHFTGPLAFLGSRTVAMMDRTWLKNDATSAGTTRIANETMPAAGMWQLGSGRVISIAATLAPIDVTALAERFAQPLSDPRFKVTWTDDRTPSVQIDAASPQGFLNDLSPRVDLLDATTGAKETRAIPQTGPGEYQLALSAATEPKLAIVTINNRVIERTSLAGRYPPEFARIGNDHGAMETLAQRTGGRVIEPNDHARIDLHWPTRELPLAPWLAVLGAVSIAIALIRWRYA